MYFAYDPTQKQVNVFRPCGIASAAICDAILSGILLLVFIFIDDIWLQQRINIYNQWW